MQSEKTKKIKWARSLALIAVIALIPLLVLYFAIKSQYPTKLISVGNAELKVQIATTSQQKERGLCCRDSLPENFGMLFVYEKPGDYHYWMKNTRIPLDIIWLNAQKKIVHIEQNVQPSSYPQRYGANTPSQYVIETNAGYVKRHSVKIGDQLEF